MKRALAFILVLAVCLSLCACGSTESTPAKVEPEALSVRTVMDFGGGQYAVEDFALCQNAEIALLSLKWNFSSSSGSTGEKITTVPYHLPADEDSTIFAIKGNFKNLSSDSVLFTDLAGSVVIGKNDPCELYAAAIQPSDSESYTSLGAGEETRLVFYAQIPNTILASSNELIVDLAGKEFSVDTTKMNVLDEFGFDPALKGSSSDSDSSEEDSYREIPYDPAIVILDDNYLTITVTSRYEDKEYYNKGTADFYELGFKLHIVNKTDDKYISASFKNVSFDDTMASVHFWTSDYISPGKQGVTDIHFLRKEKENDECANVVNAEDMINIDGVIQLYYNTDGGNSGKGLKKVSFHID